QRLAERQPRHAHAPRPPVAARQDDRQPQPVTVDRVDDGELVRHDAALDQLGLADPAAISVEGIGTDELGIEPDDADRGWSGGDEALHRICRRGAHAAPPRMTASCSRCSVVSLGAASTISLTAASTLPDGLTGRRKATASSSGIMTRPPTLTALSFPVRT